MDNIIQFILEEYDLILLKSWEHLSISIMAVFLGSIIAIPLGITLTRFPRTAEYVMGIASIVQTFPSLAILAFFIPILGVGTIPAVAALFFYSILPILRNTYTGIKKVDRNIIEAGRGMGMTSLQLITHVELPLAIPVIMAGVRVATVYIIGWATLASFIGAGGLGDLIFTGLNLVRTELIVVGAVPSTIMALIADNLLGRLEKWVTPSSLLQIKEGM